MKADYRESHLEPGKGESYHEAFLAKPYRRMVWEFEMRVLDCILRDSCWNSEIRYLDFACGTGRILSYLADRTAYSVGVDLSPSMLAVARRNNVGAEIIEADLTKNDVLGERKFDLITAFRFFPNAQPDLRREVMQILSRHLAEGGHVVFNNHKNTESSLNRIARLLRRGFHGMSTAEVNALLRDSDLEIVKVYHLCVLPVSEGFPLLPVFALRPIEAFLSKLRPLRNLAGNLIFVCRRSTTTAR